MVYALELETKDDNTNPFNLVVNSFPAYFLQKPFDFYPS